MYGRKSYDVAGYTFDGEIYCQEHAPDTDERNPVFVDQLEDDETCGVCGEVL